MAQAFLFFQARGAGEMHGRTNGTSWPLSLPGVISAGVLYGFVYAGMRLAISHNLPQDDVTSNILAQTLEPGYVLKHNRRFMNGCCGRCSALPGRRCRASSF